MAMKTKLHFSISIQAPVVVVYDKMLGLTHLSDYESWTALFNPTSTYEGVWEKGSKILFIGVDENGAKGGLVSFLAENKPHEFVSIQHKGLYQNGIEIIEGPVVEKWANGFENYSFNEENGITHVQVELDSNEDFAEYMNESYPLALEKLKDICEK